MVAIPYVAWLLAVLRRLPAPLLLALDAWSYGIARKRAERRRKLAAHSKLFPQK